MCHVCVLQIALDKKEEGPSAIAAYTYGYTKGVFGGIGVQGTYITARNKMNAQYYGLPVETDALIIMQGMWSER